jgi:precorrin-6B methylase 2
MLMKALTPPLVCFRMVATVAIVALVALPGCAQSKAAPAELEQLVKAMRLQPGMHVADVGAGEGEWSEALAREVGPTGRVYATEVDEDDLEDIRERLASTGLDNFTVVLGNQETTGLSEDCCDAVLLRLVYHHFTDPASMREDLRAVLRPGSPLVVIDIRPQKSWQALDGVPERDGHGISPDDLIEEMIADGFEVVARFDEWEGDDDHFCVVFKDSAEGDSAAAPHP